MIATTIVTNSENEQMLRSNKFVKSDGKDWPVEGDASTFTALIPLRQMVRVRRLNHVISFHSSIAREKESGK